MSGTYRIPLPVVCAAVAAVCLGGLGCQTEVSHRILSGANGSGTRTEARYLPPPTPEGQAPSAGVILTSGQEVPLGNGATWPNGHGPGGAAAPGPVVGEGGAPQEGPAAVDQPIPVELNKVSLPPYMIEPPDILLIDTVRMIPCPPYRVEPLDVLLVQLAEPLPNQPLGGTYPVSPDGTINLGFTYGLLRVAGMTLPEVEVALRNHLGRVLRNPQVVVALAQYRGIQQVRGEHLVSPDGTISLGTYGFVYVAGLTRPQARCAIERHLSQFVLNPQISLDVFAYNSKVYYVIFDGGGYGQQVYRFPITGNETVLDALSNTVGLPSVSSRRRIWVARPAPCHHGCDQILPVDWLAITEGGSTCTNYQIFPGDRVYVKADCLIALDNALAKILSPIERVFGVTLLGSATVQSLRNNNGNNLFGTPVITTVR
jgi:polysaccharide export outer membrane protein